VPMKHARNYKNADAPLMEAFQKAGGLRRAAKALSRTPASLSGWKRCPAEHVLAIEAISGVPRERLRPDIYPPQLQGGGGDV